jgi:hypothetical protein
MADILQQHNVDYWWNKGTLIGLFREGDIVYTDVDTDIAITNHTRRDRRINDPDLINDFAEIGYNIEQRDSLKLRLYGPWGFFADMNIFTPWERQYVVFCNAHEVSDACHVAHTTALPHRSLFGA